jgi:hypothetical protein
MIIEAVSHEAWSLCDSSPDPWSSDSWNRKCEFAVVKMEQTENIYTP